MEAYASVFYLKNSASLLIVKIQPNYDILIKHMFKNNKQILYQIILSITFSIALTGGFLVAQVPITDQPQWLAIAFVSLLTLPTWIGLLGQVGIKRGILLIFVLSITASAIEGFALTTGFPYGHFTYYYTAGYKLFNLVPLTVPLSWSTLIIGSYAIVSHFGIKKFLPTILSMIACMIGIDLLMDPVMVSLRVWTWDVPGWYYGVPLVNYLGWIGSGMTGAMIMYGGMKHTSRLDRYTGLMTLGLYLFIIFWLIIAFMRGLWIPGLIGIVFLIITRRSFIRLFKIVE